MVDRIITICVAFSVLAASTRTGLSQQHRVETQRCSKLRDATADQLVQLLKSGNIGDADCMAVAIKNVGYDHLSSGVDLLLQYLDFIDPEYEVRRTSNVSNGILPPWAKYPAIDALHSFGLSVEPKVIDAIAFKEMSELARRNAVTTIELNHSGEEKLVVVLLNDANRSSRDAVASRRLLEASRRAVMWCPKETMYLCEAVLLDQSGKN
jgi:hypothetical protein